MNLMLIIYKANRYRPCPSSNSKKRYSRIKKTPRWLDVMLIVVLIPIILIVLLLIGLFLLANWVYSKFNPDGFKKHEAMTVRPR